MKYRPFTLLEVLIVFVVIGLILAVAAPRLIERSDRLARESALTAIRSAVNDAAMRARSTGRALTLVLDEDENALTVGEAEENLERRWQPPSHGTDDSEEGDKSSFLTAQNTYKLPSDIEWQISDDVHDDDGNIVLTFFPDGQAAGPELEFSVAGRNYILRIDRITADPVILEVTD